MGFVDEPFENRCERKAVAFGGGQHVHHADRGGAEPIGEGRKCVDEPRAFVAALQQITCRLRRRARPPFGDAHERLACGAAALQQNHQEIDHLDEAV